ncbi:MAG TPA: iron ABC transporter permease [Gammaproteobacteria bacterium]|nr:iron ABC transporter permease [Gammaproteobacteria bacterium]
MSAPGRIAALQIAAVLCALLVSLAVGAASIPLDTLLAAPFGGDGDAWLILREVRLPRALLALAIGAGLGTSGAALQALLRNPLAEPGVVGISSTAALGAVLAFYTGLSLRLPLALPLGGLAGALAGTLLMLRLTRGTGASLALILAGVALTTFASAGTSLVLSLAPNPYAAYEIIFWLMGSLADRSLTHVALAVPFILAGLALLLHAARDLEALALGEDSARSLGVDVARLRLAVVVGTALAVGPGVAVAGFIGFVGLLVPHALRPFVGSRPARLLPQSALGGALATLIADIACRLVPTLGELKLGIVTALLGAPFFLWLLTRERRLHA